MDIFTAKLAKRRPVYTDPVSYTHLDVYKRQIVEDAENYLGEKVEEAVISVPAYFHDRQRTAAKKAGALAGVQVNRIINEPSAAALASYFDTDMEQVFLVFDFGGGTLDISVVDCFDTMVELSLIHISRKIPGPTWRPGPAP